MSILTQDDGQNQGIENSSIATTDTPYTSIIAKSDFDIRNYVHLLEPNPDSKDKYICPNCGKNDLSIKRESSEYNCFSGCGDNKAIRRKCLELDGSLPPSIEPVALPVYESRKKDLKVSKLPEKLDMSPSKKYDVSVEKDGTTHYKPIKTEYVYGENQVKVRLDYEDEGGAKKKKVWYKSPVDNDSPWMPYKSEAITGDTVLWVEGELCADYVAYHLGLSVFYSNDKTCPEALRKVLTERGVENVIIFPDNDEPGSKAAKKVQGLMESFGLTAITLNPMKVWQEMPDKGDCVDWIDHFQSKGSFNVEELIKVLEYQIKEVVESSRKANEKQARKKDPDIEKVRRSLSNPSPLEVLTTVEDTVLRSLFQAEDKWIVIGNNFHKYVGNSIYKHIPDVEIERMVTVHLRELYVKSTDRKGNERLEYRFATEGNKKNSVKFCRSFLSKDLSNHDNNYLISFNNGVLNVRTSELLGHSEEYYLTSGFQEDYIASDACPPIAQKWIVETFGEENLILLRAIFSMYLDPSAPWGYFVHLQGQSGSGKGTLIDLIQSFFPQENISALGTFAEISTPEKRHQQLSNVKIASFEDLGGFQSNIRDFYKLVDNNLLNGRQLNNATGYSRRWNVRFISASVLPLGIENAGDGWSRRCISIPMKRRDTKIVNPNLKEELRAFKSEIIMWALSMPKDERDNLIKTARFLPQLAEARAEQNRNSSSVLQFIDACLIPSEDPSKTVDSNNMWNYYSAFCESYGLKALAVGNFIPQIKDAIHSHYVKRKSVKRNGKVDNIPTHFKNIDFVPYIFSQGSMGKAYVCDKTHCSEGGIAEFEAFVFPPTDTALNNAAEPRIEPVSEAVQDKITKIAEVCHEDGSSEVVRIVDQKDSELTSISIDGRVIISKLEETVIFDDDAAKQRCQELNTTPEQLGLPIVGNWIAIEDSTVIVTELREGRYIVYKTKGINGEMVCFKQDWKAIDKTEYARLGLQAGIPC